MIKENSKTKTAASTIIKTQMGRVNSLALTAALAVCFVFPVNAFSMPNFVLSLPGARSQTTTSQAVARTCSQSAAKQITGSDDTRAKLIDTFSSKAVGMFLGIFGLNYTVDNDCDGN
jgi:hypothetical protein